MAYQHIIRNKVRGRTAVCKTETSSKGEGCFAFTLIELLVVVAIIAILAALLQPALARSKTNAQQAACLNNVSQMTVAGLMYMSDTAQGLPQNNPLYSNYDPYAPGFGGTPFLDTAYRAT